MRRGSTVKRGDNAGDGYVDQLIATNEQLQDEVIRLLDAQQELLAERARYRALIDQAPDYLFLKDLDGRFVVANKVFAETLGMAPDDLIGKTDYDLISAEMAEQYAADDRAVMKSGTPTRDIETRVVDASGNRRYSSTSKAPLRDKDGRIIGLVGVSRDVTPQRLAREELRAERNRFRAMIDQVPDYLFVKDMEGRFVVANRAVAADLGREPDELIGKSDHDLHPSERAEKFRADERRIVRNGEPMIDIEEYIIDRGGHQKHFLTTKVPLRDPDGEIIGLIGVCRDVTLRRQAQEEVRFLAHHDALTRLPNREVLLDRADQAIRRAKRDNGRVAVAFLDLDGFKMINDGLGHNAGDQLLRIVADRMVEAVRDTDTVVRLGGDEFVILLPDQSRDISVLTGLINRVRASIRQPIELDGELVEVTSSVGVAIYPHDGDDGDELIKNADAAMYQAKQLGRDDFCFFTREMDSKIRNRLMMLAALRSAVRSNQLRLEYQPECNLETGEIVAVEALARWNHPDFGEVSPERFIPLAEESGFIFELGDWVLREACRQCKAWHDAGLPRVRVAVNVSPRQFEDPEWSDRIRNALRDTGLAPRYLELELTERTLMRDVERAIAVVSDLQATGIAFAIDDFGTGYSNLSALRQLPLSRLKMDRSLVEHLPASQNDAEIASTVIALGQKLHMKVVAEGVERRDQLAFLNTQSCDEVQGFFLHRPMAPDKLEQLLETRATET